MERGEREEQKRDLEITKSLILPTVIWGTFPICKAWCTDNLTTVPEVNHFHKSRIFKYKFK